MFKSVRGLSTIFHLFSSNAYLKYIFQYYLNLLNKKETKKISPYILILEQWFLNPSTLESSDQLNQNP